MILHKDRQFCIIHTARGKIVGHQPFKKLNGQNIEFLCKISTELIYFFFYFFFYFLRNRCSIRENISTKYIKYNV
jgi:hypothetical protein